MLAMNNITNTVAAISALALVSSYAQTYKAQKEQQPHIGLPLVIFSFSLVVLVSIFAHDCTPHMSAAIWVAGLFLLFSFIKSTRTQAPSSQLENLLYLTAILFFALFRCDTLDGMCTLRLVAALVIVSVLGNQLPKERKACNVDTNSYIFLTFATVYLALVNSPENSVPTFLKTLLTKATTILPVPQSLKSSK